MTGGRLPRCRSSIDRTSLQRWELERAIKLIVTLRHAVLLVARSWSGRRRHGTGRIDDTTKARQTLTTVIRCDGRGHCWRKHVCMLTGRLTKRKWCTWSDWCASRNACVARWHDALEGGLVTVNVESTAFDVRAQRSDVVSFFRMMIRWHGLISHASVCWRLEAEVAKNRQGTTDRSRGRARRVRWETSC